MNLALQQTTKPLGAGVEHKRGPGAPSSSGRLLCVLFVLICSTHTGLAHTNASKTVLVLYDTGREFSAVAMLDQNIEITLNDALSNRVTIFREYMDLTRIGPTHYDQVLRDFYRSKYSRIRPDVIVAVHGRPLDFLLKHGDELFPGVPIVSSAMDPRQVNARTLPSNVTGVSLPLTFWPTIALALKLQPETEQVVIVGGASPLDRAFEKLARDDLREHESQVKFSYLIGLPMDELVQRVSSMPPRSVILYILVTQDGEGRSFLPDDALTRLSRAANAPTYIFCDNLVGCGAVGGDLVSVAGCGRDTARLALRILQGESAANIPFTNASARVKMLDAGQLKRWGISLARAPADSIVLNRQPTMWETYHWQIVGGISLIMCQSALIATLLLQRRRRRLAEENLRISEAHRQVAVLEERNRMARDMHDTLAQGFTGVIVQLDAAQQSAAHGSSADMDAHIHRASDLARQSLGEARRSIRGLRPQVLENGSLCIALDGVTKQMMTGTGLRAEFTIQGDPYPLASSSEENLLRIYQEILTNALKHSGARLIKATLSFEESAVRLEVRDDGVGFDRSRKHDGLGLLGIRERVIQMDGELAVESLVGRGATIRIVLPNQSIPRGAEV